jgi:hypothetical protein
MPTNNNPSDGEGGCRNAGAATADPAGLVPVLFLMLLAGRHRHGVVDQGGSGSDLKNGQIALP